MTREIALTVKNKAIETSMNGVNSFERDDALRLHMSVSLSGVVVSWPMVRHLCKVTGSNMVRTLANDLLLNS